MNFKLQLPDMVLEARQKQKGWNLVLEILLFLGLFLLSQVVIGLLANIPVLVFFMSKGILDESTGVIRNAAELQQQVMNVALPSMLYAELIGIFLILGLCKWIQKRKGRTLGFKKRDMMKEYGIGLLAGFAMMTIIVLIAWISGALHISFNQKVCSGQSITMLIILFIGFLFQGMFEEVLCRGYFLTSIARRKGNVWLGIFVSSLAFAALHLLNAGITLLAFVNLTLFGIFAGIYYVKRGDIWGIGALHSAWNFAQGNVWGVLVSGNNFGPSIFTAEASEDLALLNGGAFGLEGGILTSLLLIVGSLLLLKLPQKDAAAEEIPAAAPVDLEN